MKPLDLKEPTPCCKSPTALWSREKQRYICPCGEFQATLNGQLFGKKVFTYGGHRPPKNKHPNS